jgi:hypothetical protein
MALALINAAQAAVVGRVAKIVQFLLVESKMTVSAAVGPPIGGRWFVVGSGSQLAGSAQLVLFAPVK